MLRRSPEQERYRVAQRTRAALAAKRARDGPLSNLGNLDRGRPVAAATLRGRARKLNEPYRQLLIELGGGRCE
jgi:hypothetical protein